jgi:hypothetical protein
VVKKLSYNVRNIAKKTINGYTANNSNWNIMKTKAEPRLTIDKVVPKPLSSKYSFKPVSSFP